MARHTYFLKTPAATSFRGSGGVSQKNRSQGFLPAFYDTQTGAVYLSRFANGQPAPMYLVEGLQSDLLSMDQVFQQIIDIKNSVIVGFVQSNHFYTRQELDKC
jgi:hypothetical protein